MRDELIFKIVVIGDLTEGKNSLLNSILINRFKENYKSTLGVNLLKESLIISDEKGDDLIINLQVWDISVKDSFRSLYRVYFDSSNGAIIFYDITNPGTLDRIPEWIQMIRKFAGEIPIILVGIRVNLENQEVSKEEVMMFKEKFNLSEYFEISAGTREIIPKMFEELTRLILKNYNIDHGKINYIVKYENLKHKVNEYITLKLEFTLTNIYVKGRKFNQCRHLLLGIPVDDIGDYDEIDSIDEALEIFRKGANSNYRPIYITPKQEFWGHCSNIQAWVEHNYDTRLLHSNLAFPLLKELVDVGDPQAKRGFKEEIAMRLESGYPSVIEFLKKEKYLKYLSREELKSIIEANPHIKDFLKKKKR